MNINRVRVIERVKYSLRYKHRRGHRIHSPYVYGVVREFFVKKTPSSLKTHPELINMLCGNGIKYNLAYRVGQFMTYNNLNSVALNPTDYNNEDLVIFSNMSHHSSSVIESMRERGNRSAIIFLNIYRRKECRSKWRGIIGLKLDLYELGIVVIDDHLNNEYYKLKIS